MSTEKLPEYNDFKKLIVKYTESNGWHRKVRGWVKIVLSEEKDYKAVLFSCLIQWSLGKDGYLNLN